MLKLIWQPATAPPPLHLTKLCLEFLNIMGREEKKWAYSYTWATSLFIHHIYDVRIELALSGILGYLTFSASFHRPSALTFSASLHVCPLSAVRKSYLKD